jgi:hypothetical protein
MPAQAERFGARDSPAVLSLRRLLFKPPENRGRILL